MRPTICSLFEPHYEQNLYANPKRTAKSSFYLFDSETPLFVQSFFKNFLLFALGIRLSKNIAEISSTQNPSHRSYCTSRATKDFLKFFSCGFLLGE
jgi:hypothetical protein